MMPSKYQTIKLLRDINPVVTQGMKGVILEVLSPNEFEVEFLNEQGKNYVFDGQYTFTIKATDFQLLTNTSID